MNNPLNIPQNPNELVLRLIGGERDGQLFTVENEKCLLSSFLPSNVDAENYRCAIFRGVKGVAFRSYSDHVLCNGAKVSVQWLKKGDLIKVTDSFSVEVYQLGVYTKKPAAASTASRPPAQTIEISDTATPSPSRTAPIAARPVTPTIPSSSTTIVTPPANAAGQISPPAEYAKPSVQFPSVSASSGETPKFKPATENLRTPTVTAPIPTAQVPTEPQAPTASVSRMPAPPQALNVSLPTPSAPSSSTIDSLSERLSKLVDSAAGNEESPSLDSESLATSTSYRPSVSTMAIEPAPTEPTSPSTEPTPEAPVRQSATTVAQPVSPPISTPTTTQVEAPTLVDSTTAPVVEAATGESSTGGAEQAGSDSSAVDRRSALESYFAKSGVNLSDTILPTNENATLANPVAPAVASVELAAAVTPEVPVESPVAPTNPSRQPVVTQEVKATPEFDLDSILAKLESESSASPSLTPGIESPQIQQPLVNEPPVAETSIVETSIVETPVVETPVVGSTFEQPPVEPENSHQSSPEAESGDQDGELKSFALLQSLGLDTSGLGQIKEELAKPPLREEVESIALAADQQTAPVAAEPEKVESVADVLARMQNAGSLQDFKAGEDKAESTAAEIAQRDVPTPPPATPPNATAESLRASSGVEGGGGVESDGGVEGDGAVEDYMSQLLNRMRGESEPTSGEVAEQNQDKAIEEIAAENQQQVIAAPTQPVEQGPLTQEEFVPKQKAVRMQKLDSLRAFANSNSREAFQKSVAKERKVNTQTKLTLSVFSLLFAFMFFIMSCLMKDQINFWGVAFGLVFLIIGLMTARTYLNERKLDKSILSD